MAGRFGSICSYRSDFNQFTNWICFWSKKIQLHPALSVAKFSWSFKRFSNRLHLLTLFVSSSKYLLIKGGVDDLINTLIKKSLKKGLFNYRQDIVMAFSPPFVCCLVKKGLQKGGSRAPQDPPWLRLCFIVTKTIGLRQEFQITRDKIIYVQVKRIEISIMRRLFSLQFYLSL